jgi:hypothetical protein
MPPTKKLIMPNTTAPLKPHVLSQNAGDHGGYSLSSNHMTLPRIKPINIIVNHPIL